MKKLLLTATAVFALTIVNAQTEKGSLLIETNIANQMVGTTSFSFNSVDGESVYGIGVDGGYFVIDDLAIKVGLGYSGNSLTDTNAFSYRIGGKYYLMGNIPLTLDYTGASIKDYEENPSWLGLGAGYAIFLGENVSIEPGLRYNLTMNEDFSDENIFQFNIGFALHF
ncbi:porin family protein [Flavobacteriaceae bacterium]|jgi:hypothetical protein|nr:porin family protein [Flavobacteriaceae bacterium]MDG1394734.1 hypothetical protein [Flavobacteriaceae bacterium]